MIEIKEIVYDDLISTTKRILNLDTNDFRITDKNLFSKNPKYPLCDIVLKLDVVYSIEYLLNLWELISKQEPKFIFKNTGSSVSMSCYLHPSVKVETQNIVKEFNILRMNESLIVCMDDIEAIKPSSRGVLIKCIIRRNRDSTFILEFVAFGPENENEYNSLLKTIFNKNNQLIKQDKISIIKYGLKRKSTTLRQPIKKDIKMTSRSKSIKPLYVQHNLLKTNSNLKSFTQIYRNTNRILYIYKKIWFIFFIFIILTLVIYYAIFKKIY